MKAINFQTKNSSNRAWVLTLKYFKIKLKIFFVITNSFFITIKHFPILLFIFQETRRGNSDPFKNVSAWMEPKP